MNGTNGANGKNGTNGTTASKFETEVVVIGDEMTQEPLISSVKDIIKDFTHFTPTVAALGSTATDGKICIVLSELNRPVVSSLTCDEFQAIQKMLAGAAGVLWAVRGAYTESSNPDAEMVVGMARSVRSETLLSFATLDLGTITQLSNNDTEEKIQSCF